MPAFAYGGPRGTHTAREDPQHRHHRAHRRGQDHHDRADPLLHRQEPQDRRGPRGQHHHRLHGPGAGAGHHHHLRRRDRRVEGPPDQHHRHAGPHRFQHRGEPLAARARRRRVHHRGRGRRAAAVRDQLAPGRPLQRPAHHLHQQARPHRRRLLPRRRDADREARHRLGDPAAPDRHRGHLQGRGRPRRDEGADLGGRRARRAVPRRADPGRPEGPGGGVPPDPARHRALASTTRRWRSISTRATSRSRR